MGYVILTLEYSIAALSRATQTNLATLDNVQPSFADISGAMRTTQQMHVRLNATLSHWTSVEMLQSSQLMNATRCSNTIHTKRALIQTCMKKTRIKQQSYLTIATALLPEYNLPCSRENIATVAPQPLYRQYVSQPCAHTSL